jgi:hypothetical protein
VDVVAVEPLAPFEERELDQEAARHDGPAELLHQPAERPRGPARRQQVVVDEDPRAARDRVAVELERVGAVLEDVLGAHGLARQLARLAGEHEPGAELARERRPEQEPARLGADDDVDVGRRQSAQPRDRRVETGGVGEHGRDVLEADPRLREVRDLADEGAQVDGHRAGTLADQPSRGSADDLAQVPDEQQVLEVRRHGREVLERLDRLLPALGVARAERRSEDLL